MKKFLVPLIPLFFIACGNEESKKEEHKQETTTIGEVEVASEEDSLDDLIVADEPISAQNFETVFDFLKALTPNSDTATYKEIDFLENELNQEYQNIQSVNQLFGFYKWTLPRGVSAINSIINKYDTYPEENWEHWNKVSSKFSYIDIDQFCSECSFEAAMDVYPLYEIAEFTESKYDDDFFDCLDLFYNGKQKIDEILVDVGNNYAFYSLNCDFCAYNELGSGVFYDVLMLTQNHNDSLNPFREELKRIEERTIGFMYTDCYAYDKESILEEIEVILELNLEDKNKQKVEEYKQKISSSETISLEGDCEFDF